VGGLKEQKRRGGRFFGRKSELRKNTCWAEPRHPKKFRLPASAFVVSSCAQGREQSLARGYGDTRRNSPKSLTEFREAAPMENETRTRQLYLIGLQFLHTLRG
jgi:hypothetical protein